MFTYELPAPAKLTWGRKQRSFDAQARRGLKKAMKVEKMSMAALRKELIKEWTRTEWERSEAPGCPQLKVVSDEGAQPSVKERFLVKDGWEHGECAHVVTTVIPLPHWWDWVAQPQGSWGQWSVWSMYSDWSATQKKREVLTQQRGENHG